MRFTLYYKLLTYNIDFNTMSTSILSDAQIFYVKGYLTKDRTDALFKDLNNKRFERHLTCFRDNHRKSHWFGDYP